MTRTGIYQRQNVRMIGGCDHNIGSNIRDQLIKFYHQEFFVPFSFNKPN